MMVSTLNLELQTHDLIWKHLLPPRPKAEEAGFCFVREKADREFECLDWYPVPDAEFDYHSLYHIELTDECRARVVKRAHVLAAAVFEFHSHPYPRPAEFSPSDLSGFSEFVPHVRWRLRGRAYGAFVAAPSGFDSLIWTDDSAEPSGILQLKVAGELLEPTSRTLKHLRGF